MSSSNFFNLIKQQQVEFVDFRFTDQLGKWHHFSFNSDKLDDNLLKCLFLSDAIDIAGFNKNNQHKLRLVPDLSSSFLDPFTTLVTLVVICDIYDTSSNLPYDKDPRSVAKKAQQYLNDSAIIANIQFAPDLEFFIFDDVRFKISPTDSFVKINSEESPSSSGKKFSAGNYAHRPSTRSALMSVQPVDSLNDIRAEIITVLKSVGIDTIFHHHGLSPSQCNLSIMPNSLLAIADNVQKYKYVVHNVAHSYGKSASFMPKPIKDEKGSGMNLIQLSSDNDIMLHYMAGIVKHLRVISAFTNPSTNSYKRLLADSIEVINISDNSYYNQKVIEAKFPDCLCNPYYGFAAILMAGIDGIINKIDPIQVIEDNKISNSLDESLDALANEGEFLKKNNVFSDDLITSYIKIKKQELAQIAITPHPLEFQLYYSS